jgi:hypothetical protein
MKKVNIMPMNIVSAYIVQLSYPPSIVQNHEKIQYRNILLDSLTHNSGARRTWAKDPLVDNYVEGFCLFDTLLETIDFVVDCGSLGMIAAEPTLSDFCQIISLGETLHDNRQIRLNNRSMTHFCGTHLNEHIRNNSSFDVQPIEPIKILTQIKRIDVLLVHLLNAYQQNPTPNFIDSLTDVLETLCSQLSNPTLDDALLGRYVVAIDNALCDNMRLMAITYITDEGQRKDALSAIDEIRIGPNPVYEPLCSLEECSGICPLYSYVS